VEEVSRPGKIMKFLESIPICSNALFKYKLDIQEDLTLKFKEEQFEYNSPALPGVNCFAGKDYKILKKYKNLNDEINKAVNSTIKEILMLDNTQYEIFSSWLTKTEPKAFSKFHNHTNCWLSGVYYPKGDPGFGIKFNYGNVSQFQTSATDYNIYNSTEWNVVAEDNLLILFFSQLQHQITPNNSSKDRYSLAFNIIPRGSFGTMDSTVIF
tara:strand:- start:37 stop:669 length:633 start_codon:yes stop_codon:yes gene_type:complete